MRDKVKKGDGVLFYHSRVDPMAAVGVCRVVKEAYADPTQFDKKSKYFDAKATKESPRWFVVEIKFEEEFAQPVTLKEMRTMAPLNDMVLLRKGSRLSIQPVKSAEWNAIVRRGRA